MEIAVIGTGFIGGILGRALAGAGHQVTFGSRHPADEAVANGTRWRSLQSLTRWRKPRSSSSRCPARRSPD